VSYVDLIPTSTDTWLARRDARLKLAWLGTASLAAVLVDSAPALVGLCSVTLLVALGLGWTRRTWLVVGGILLAVAWGTVLSQAMFFAGEPRTPLITIVSPVRIGWFEFPGVRLYREGASYGLLQSSRMIAMMLAGLTVCLSTSPERLLAALAWLRVPAAASFMTVAALRFLPTVADEWATVRGSCRLRGYHRRLLSVGRGAWRSWRIEAALLVPVIAASLRRAEKLATSLTARGFDAAQTRTLYPAVSMGWLDVVIVILLAALSVSLSLAKSLFWLAASGIYGPDTLAPLYEFARAWL
jgi:energy-coupling factor transport system permease protein